MAHAIDSDTEVPARAARFSRAGRGDRPAVCALIAVVSLAISAGLAGLAIFGVERPMAVTPSTVIAIVWALAFALVAAWACAIAIVRLSRP